MASYVLAWILGHNKGDSREKYWEWFIIIILTSYY